MATISPLRYSPQSSLVHRSVAKSPFSDHATLLPTFAFLHYPSPLRPTNQSTTTGVVPFAYADGSRLGGGGSGSSGGYGNGGGGGGDHGEHDDNNNNTNDRSESFGPIGAFVSGWRSRVAADPEFPFKVLMEELVGVSSCALGDMASRPNFGLNELDFVFSTLVVGSIVNFVLMYLLAPTTASASSTLTNSFLSSLFANCPTSHMFEPGPYGLLDRFGTFVYKGAAFAAVGFAAGLVGTAISNALIKMRKKMDPSFETPNKPPPTVLNALTWAIHMGVSSNFRYQTLNGVEFVLAKALSPFTFKTSVVVLRCLNNVLGGMSFVVLARLTGSQSLAVDVDHSMEGKVLETIPPQHTDAHGDQDQEEDRSSSSSSSSSAPHESYASSK